MAARARSNARLCTRLASALVLAALSGSCTAIGDPAGFAIVTQDKYDFMACPEIIGQRNGLVAREKDLSKMVEKAEESVGGMLAGAIAYRSELVSIRAQLAAAQRAAQKNGCDAPKKP